MTDQERAERVVALVEEMRNNTREMRSLEDLCATYNALHELVGDLLILPRKEEEDGRYDPFV